MTWAIALLCAGLGTRLRPLTSLVPKPLVPIGDRPLIDHAVTSLQSAGARDFSFNAFYLAEQVQDYVARASKQNTSTRCVVERELLGTAGGVRGLNRDHEHLLVWNGDIYAPEIDLPVVFSFGRQEWPVLVVAPTALGRGTVGLDRAGRVVRLRGQTFGVEVRGVDYIGIAVFPRAFLDRLPRHGCLVGDGLIPWLAQGKPVTTIGHGGYWSDGGTVEQYLAQNQHWLSRHVAGVARCNPLGAARESAQTPVDSFVGEASQCAPTVHIERSVIGRGSQVVGNGNVRRCVVWPGAVATAPIQDAVVMTDGTVVRVAASNLGGLG